MTINVYVYRHVFIHRYTFSRFSFLVWFYSISTIVSYLMPNPVFTYKLDIGFVNIFCRYTQLND